MADLLNASQLAAVEFDGGNSMVLAGAGSGKTRVLVYRIVWFMEQKSMQSHEILALTFTNKVAKEMRERIAALIPYPTSSMWVGTFHSIAHRLLRYHHAEAGLSSNFQVIDMDDQVRIIKSIMKQERVDEKTWNPKQFSGFFSQKKEQGKRAAHIVPSYSDFSKVACHLYGLYEQYCKQNELLDFSELLLRSYELWRERPDILSHYQQKFKAILVDEFQDTNAIQYAWLNALANKSTLMTVVGDDDQSIYGWRGAVIENMLNYEKDFAPVQVFRLEQNYRSTGNILKAANELISCNSGRIGKQLWTDGDKGDLISLYTAFNEVDEAKFIARQMKRYADKSYEYKQMAVLYRSNAQSRALEEVFIAQGIPYRIYGGLRFFERAEIKHVLAYLRLMLHRNDNQALERIINVPARGIGNKTQLQMQEIAEQTGRSFWESLIHLVDTGALTARARKPVEAFVELIKLMEDSVNKMPLPQFIESVLSNTGLLNLYRKDQTQQNQAKLENLAELVSAVDRFAQEFGYEDTASAGLVDDAVQTSSATSFDVLASFLDHTALEAGEYSQAETENSVQLMTLHAAKGLEFSIVFLTGLEESLFPTGRAMQSEDDIEEERRLCYVGITRAMEKLFITHAESRRLYGVDKPMLASRFIGEVPSELIEEMRFVPERSAYGLSNAWSPTRETKSKQNMETATISSAATLSEYADEDGMAIGSQVRHSVFGEGVIINAQGQGEQVRVQVRFESQDVRWLMVRYAKLEVLS